MKKYSIKAYLRTDKLNKETNTCPVVLTVTMRGKCIRVGQANLQVSPAVWDVKKGLVDISKLNKNAKDYRIHKADCEELNKTILHQLSEFNRFMLEQERLGITVTPDKVRNYFDVGKTISFYDFWDKQIELMKPNLRASTLFSYENTKKILKLFKPHLDFGDVNAELIKRWDNYLKEERGNNDGGRYNRHKNLKAILKAALHAKLIEENPYQFFKVKEAKGDRMRLTLTELQMLRRLVLPEEHKNLEDVKNMFLFSCYTGLRFSDVQNLKWKDISFDEAMLEVKMVKTSDNIRIPLIPDALQILYGLREYQLGELHVFKRITNQAVNRSIKVIIDLVGIKKRITFHCGRHTFATLNYSISKDVYMVKGLLGHKNIADTQIYTKLLDESVNESMFQFGQKIMGESKLKPVRHA